MEPRVSSGADALARAAALSEPLRAPAEAYAQRLKAALAQGESLERRSAVLGNLRGFAFVAAVALAALTFFGKVPRATWIAVAALTGSYAALVVSHDRVLRLKRRFSLLARLNERGIARLTGEWHRFGERGDEFRQPNHLYTEDLDIFGQGSLFQLINETGTRFGESALAECLSRGAAAADVRQRQGAVGELAALIDFRQELLLECRLASAEKADPRAFIDWAEGGPYLKSIAWAQPFAWLIRAITAALLIGGQREVVPAYAWLAGVVLSLLLAALTRRPLEDFYSRLSASEMGFVAFASAFERVDRELFRDPLLTRLSTRLAGKGASAQLRRFARGFSFAELRQSRMMHAIIDSLVLWDLHVFFRLERWREQVGRQVRHWFATLAELEALCSLATLARLQVLTSMRVRDSLELGVSHFYAEVRRIKAVLDAAAAAHGRALFLLDEILWGTNTRERQIASREVLRLLLATGAMGAVSTHDLSLASLEHELAPNVRNYHFKDLLTDGRMTFDYRLRPGILDTTNALRVLRQVGIPIGESKR